MEKCILCHLGISEPDIYVCEHYRVICNGTTDQARCPLWHR
jgi:hypothetical protein